MLWGPLSPLGDVVTPPAPMVEKPPLSAPPLEPVLDLSQIQADTQRLQEVIDSTTNTSCAPPLVEDPSKQVTRKYTIPVHSREHPQGISNPEVVPLATSGPTDPVL